MATRVNTREEKLATMRSAMNVIGLLLQCPHSHPRQVPVIDFRALLPPVEIYEDEPWHHERLVVKRPGTTSEVRH